MDLVSTKVLVAIIFGIFRFFFGMLPVKLDTCLRRWEEGSTDKKTFINAKRHQQVTCAVAMTQSFGGGVMFATCFLHMMRTLFVSVEELKKIKGITNEYPISQLMISLGFFSIYFLEEFSHWMINSNKSCTKSALDKSLMFGYIRAMRNFLHRPCGATDNASDYGSEDSSFSSYNQTHHYQQIHLGPIKDHTVLTLDIQTGKVLGKWGADLFYMPHGLTIDRHDNLWITDVALHQAYKFKPGELEPTLTFGERFTPGSDSKHLCKPTSIAVATTGEIFIADGYCNSRILKYNAAGGLLRVIPNPPEFLSLQIPHSLALIESIDRLCIADRENMRVVCPRAGLYSAQGKKEPALTIQQPDMGRVFAVAAKGKLIYAVNGPTNRMLPIQGLTIDPETESVIDHWQPEEGFTNPHDIAVCANGSALYVAEIGPNKIWKFELVPPKK
ncbi:peptidyl-alpha-hydroxyglycine alpha-amidating lyase 2-like [Sitophilus oryzae]|uniref:peptidylamidoglycolate lyase n=1 Tax=Sitophilus oryzae TaxID=7048 RepID=A0A6J2YUY3_SITOR|nr:peptidyl-alpha-hydroxyglycine alpha-amidating lyase 2-like [Sitophilus oryzae]